MIVLATVIQLNTENSSQWDKATKEVKDIQMRKEDITPPLFADDRIIYTENPRESTEKLPKLINEFSKVMGYKINR